jgi:hypothetical protein
LLIAMLDAHLVALDDISLQRVCGGDTPLPPNPVNPQPGRCGPADRWSWMNKRDGSPIVTDQCIAHDRVYDNSLIAGHSKLRAFWDASNLFVPAAASWAKRWVADRFGKH